MSPNANPLSIRKEAKEVLFTSVNGRRVRHGYQSIARVRSGYGRQRHDSRTVALK
jgi:hypothetical protein